MYFCYVDESGDPGKHDPSKAPGDTSTPYFLLGGMILNASNWKLTLGTLKTYRKDIARKAILNYDVEFHCADMITPRAIKEYQSISVPDRWRLIEDYAGIIGSNTSSKIIVVAIDKTKTKLKEGEYLTGATTALYQAFDEFLRTEKDNGIVFIDQTTGKHTNTHVRKLMGTGASGETVPGVKIAWILEDPIYRISSDSMFIQSADVIVYTLKEKLFPQASRQKLQAHKIFDRKLLKSLYKSAIAGEDGIIRI